MGGSISPPEQSRFGGHDRHVLRSVDAAPSGPVRRVGVEQLSGVPVPGGQKTAEPPHGIGIADVEPGAH